MVHPIAGRCKHCKADLAAARTARAPALAVLPPLTNAVAAPEVAPLPQIAAPAPLAVAPNAETIVGATPVQLPLSTTAPSIIAPARAAYNPIPDGSVLPPRPTGRMRARNAHERGWFARNWPVLVIILASIAIVGAVILMVWPKQEPADAGVKNGAGGPAPERMETNPLPSPNTDPWQNGQPPSAQPSQPTPPPPADPDDQSSIDPDDPLKDPFSMGGRLGGSQSITLTLLGNIAHRLCDKAKTCSDPTIATACSAMTMYPVRPLPASCPQAQRCLEIIEQVDVCDGSLGTATGSGAMDFTHLMARTTECMDAFTRC